MLPHELQKNYKKYHSNPLLWHLKWKFLASVLMSVNLKCNQIINVLVIKLIWRYILAEENDTAAYNVLQDVLGTYHRHLFWWRQILWFREYYTFGMQKKNGCLKYNAGVFTWCTQKVTQRHPHKFFTHKALQIHE